MYVSNNHTVHLKLTFIICQKYFNKTEKSANGKNNNGNRNHSKKRRGRFEEKK